MTDTRMPWDKLCETLRSSVGRWAVDDAFARRQQQVHRLIGEHPPPDEPGAYVLVVLQGQAPTWRGLPPAGMAVGRGEECDLCIEDGRVSRHHAEIRPDGQDWSVRDLGSRNGILVNGSRSASAVLRQGDVIQVGSVSLVFTRVTPVP